VNDWRSTPCRRDGTGGVSGTEEELLSLGKQLTKAQPELARMLSWVDEVWGLYSAEVRRRGTWPEDTAEWTWRDAAAYRMATERVDRELKLARPTSAPRTPWRHATVGLILFAPPYGRSGRGRDKDGLSRRWPARYRWAGGVRGAFKTADELQISVSLQPFLPFVSDRYDPIRLKYSHGSFRRASTSGGFGRR
jgi:hypothetical protein